MSGQSNVGGSDVYEAGDQRNYTDAKINAAKEEKRFHEGQENSHKAQDSKDERSIANKLERESRRDDDAKELSEESKMSQMDSALPARAHGNEPSKGARIDQELKEEEEEEELRRKGKGDAMPGKK